jgi:hypothetical protein
MMTMDKRKTNPPNSVSTATRAKRRIIYCCKLQFHPAIPLGCNVDDTVEDTLPETLHPSRLSPRHPPLPMSQTEIRDICQG